MPRTFVRSALTSLVLSVALVLVPASAQTQRDTSSADARLRALYTDEWEWRQQELPPTGTQYGPAGGSGRFPRVDAASQQARLAYWTRALATLDLSGSLADVTSRAMTEIEKEVISRALEETRGDVTRAADRLQIPARTLVSKMNALGL